jgi:hypothetical protein
VLVASPSWAAVVEPGQGNLSINQGHGFKPVKKPINARVGDSVMVGPGGAATVTYDDGCKVNVAQQWPWECPPYDPAHPDQPGGCGWQTTAFWLAFLGMGAFMGYEISQTSTAAGPASP